MPAETYSRARARLLSELAALGWSTSPNLKVPWAEPPGNFNEYKLWFKSQAVYMNQHSLWIDIRGMSVKTFLAYVQHARRVYNKYASRRRRSRRFGSTRVPLSRRFGGGVWTDGGENVRELSDDALRSRWHRAWNVSNTHDLKVLEAEARRRGVTKMRRLGP
jgi:hypothetical protein